MKFIVAFALLLIAPFAQAVTNQDKLLSFADDSDAIVSIRLTTHPKPWVEIISVWKPIENLSKEIFIEQGVNTFLIQNPSLNPPKENKSFLLFMKFPKGDFNGPPITVATIKSFEIENHSIMLDGRKLHLDDIRKLVQASLKTEQGAAANP